MSRLKSLRQCVRREILASLTAGLLAAVAIVTVGRHTSAQGADPCAPPQGNPVKCENLLQGSPAAAWDVDGSGDSTIQGFTTDISVNRGQTVEFKIDTTAAAYHLDIYRMGYYGGLGARKVATVNPSATLPQTQPNCLTDDQTGLVDCGNWAVSATWAVPADAVSGIYFAKVTRTDTGGASHIVFVVRNDAGHSDLLFQTSDTTWQAYNQYGGNSLYVGGPGSDPGRAYKVSYNRPFTTRGSAPQDWVFNAEYPMVRWLEANGYDVSYFTGVDADRLGNEILEHRSYLSVGHDEYWSGQQRTNVEAARAAGVHLAFFSGNEVFWKTRWEDSIASPATAHRTLVSYKETHANAKIDPLPNVWTGTWQDPRFSPPADGGRPPNALTGTLFSVNCCSAAITVPAAEGRMRFWRGTSIAGLGAGQVATLPNDTLGYEWDTEIDNGFRPAGLIRMSDTNSSQPQALLDYGSNYGPATVNHALTLYKTTNGSLVFGAGTVQWSWGLDSNHDRGSEPASVDMQQATVNLLADMGVQPRTLQPGLTIATQSSDTTRPTSSITSPAAGSTVPANTTITISGIAGDTGGGIVGGVEVSVDGATWHRATGRESWTYTWQTGGARTVTLLSRAVDDSGNLEQPTAGVTVTVGSGTVTCPCSIWVPTQTPTVASENDSSAVEVGTKFRSDINGFITSIRFYKGAQNIGQHTGSLWTSSGSLLGTVTFTNESASGWQQATLATPVAITANTTYVVSYHTNSGFYSADGGYFSASGVDNGPLHALRDGVDGPNGVYRYGASGFPADTYGATNYWVDVVFATSVPPDTTAPQVTQVTPPAGASNIYPGSLVTATFSENVDPATVSSATIELRNAANAVVASTITYSSESATATLRPTSMLADSTTYTARVHGGAAGVKDPAGNPLASDVAWSFSTGLAATGGCPCSLLTGKSPSVGPENDPSAVELGVRFQSDLAGYLTAIRYYKTAENTGQHIGNVWTNDGTLLTTVTFGTEGPSGWQEVALPTPLAIAANTTYVVSYHTAAGFYLNEGGYFAQPLDSGPLHAPADGPDTPNGVYRYGVSAFPTQTYQSANYWVDLVFTTTVAPDTAPPSVLSVSPTSGQTGVSFAGVTTAVFSENVDPSTISGTTVELRDGSGAIVPAAVTYSAAKRTATLTPSVRLTPLTTYSARIKGGASGVKDVAGNALPSDMTWSFTTAAPPPPPPNDGPGGPILVIGSTTNPFSRYYSEILRAEGLNSFTATDISLVNAAMLSNYDVAIVGEFPLTASQVAMLTDWVTAGGNLIAMRPDKQLASLLGLTDNSATLSEGYLLVDTSGAPGAGIFNQTMQFHGTADRYSLNGASLIARLYSNAATATSAPAVTVRAVGTNGGQAAAFTFDLARSIVQTRQGNPAWSGQERDGLAPIRSDDLFFGGTQNNWVDLSKVAVPQADEQQRLLANLIGFMNLDRKPLPKFWYFPRGLKAVVVMTGDDHGHNGTAGRFDIYNGNSPAGCNVANWECVRASSYIYPNTPITPAQAAGYTAQGFEVAVHVTTGCADYTPATLEENYANDLGQFADLFPGLPAPRTNRTHCIAWSDYDSQPQIALAHGVRLDTNYYYFPASWVKDVPGVFTGSGMPMRFAATDGSTIDVYQATTQMTDESDQTFPYTIDTLLDRALGPEGYYGAFVANMHTDVAVHPGSEAIVSSAQARGVPVISAAQLLDWLDGRNGSSFTNLAWSGSTLSFTLTAAAGANGLQSLVPMDSATGSLTAIRRNGVAVPFTQQTIKGVAYAVFAVSSGSYQVVYTVDATPPAITGISVARGDVSATVSWTTDEPATSRVEYGLSPSTLTSAVVQNNFASAHSVVLDGLTAGTQYYYRVVSTDPFGNTATAPAAPATFTTLTGPPPPQCPCSVWLPSQTPTVQGTNDGSAVEVGMRFRADMDGHITAIRFFKSAQNTGTHVGNLWTSAGTLLGSVTFTNETSTGWQQAAFPSPIAISANTTYVVSYHTNTGFYSGDGGYFANAGIDHGPLHALRDGQDGQNGLYLYGAGGFPTQSFHSANYWVDVVYTIPPPDLTPPVISGVTAVPGDTSAIVSWTTDEASTSRVDYGLTPASLTSTASVSGLATSHSVTLTNLTPGTQYYYRVTSSDASNNASSAPSSPAVFTTPAAPTAIVGDTSIVDFAQGSGAGAYVGDATDGELMLAPSVAAEFDGAAIPAGWTSTAWNAGGSSTVATGQVLVDGARLHTDAFFNAGSSVEFVATFSDQPFQHAGFGVTMNETPWAIFSTGGGGGLLARTHTGTVATDTPIPGNWLNTAHRYRIDWNVSSVVFWIDGVQVASHPVTIADQMRPIVSDYNANGTGISVNWIRLAPYATSTTFLSRVMDSGAVNGWTKAVWTSTAPAGTSLTLTVRFGNTPVPDGTWTGFQALPASGAALSQSSRYVQYQAVLTTSAPFETPTLLDIAFRAGGS